MLCHSHKGKPAEGTLLGRRMFKRELSVSQLLDLDHQRHSSIRATKRSNTLMPDTEFAEVQRQLEAVLSQLTDTEDPKLRRKKLLDMRLLLAEADRLMFASSDE